MTGCVVIHEVVNSDAWLDVETLYKVMVAS